MSDWFFDLVQFDAAARELLNGTWAWLNAFILVIFIRFIAYEAQRRNMSAYDLARADLFMGACVGMAFYHAGSFVTRAWTWFNFVLHGPNAYVWSDPISKWVWLNAGLLIGGPLAILGGACIIRSLGPQKHRRIRPWIAIALAIGIPLAALLLI